MALKKDGTPRASTTGGPGPKKIDTTSWRKELRVERVKFCDDAKQRFLREFSKHNLMTNSAKAADVCLMTVRRHLEIDEEFKAAYENCKTNYRDRVIEHGQKLIFEGIEEPIIGGEFRDEVVAHKQVVFPHLVAMEMRKVDPDYKDRKELDHKNTGGGVIVAPSGMTAEEWIAAEQERNKKTAEE
jgi:hypothetical protein